MCACWIELDLSRVFLNNKDIRRKCYIYIDFKELKLIRDVENHIKTLFGINKNIGLINQNKSTNNVCFFPSSENARLFEFLDCTSNSVQVILLKPSGSESNELISREQHPIFEYICENQIQENNEPNELHNNALNLQVNVINRPQTVNNDNFNTQCNKDISLVTDLSDMINYSQNGFDGNFIKQDDCYKSTLQETDTYIPVVNDLGETSKRKKKRKHSHKKENCVIEDISDYPNVQNIIKKNSGFENNNNNNDVQETCNNEIPFAEPSNMEFNQFVNDVPPEKLNCDKDSSKEDYVKPLISQESTEELFSNDFQGNDIFEFLNGVVHYKNVKRTPRSTANDFNYSDVEVKCSNEDTETKTRFQADLCYREKYKHSSNIFNSVEEKTKHANSTTNNISQTVNINNCNYQCNDNESNIMNKISNLDDCSQNIVSDVTWNIQNNTPETKSNILGVVIKRKRSRKHHRKKTCVLEEISDNPNVQNIITTNPSFENNINDVQETCENELPFSEPSNIKSNQFVNDIPPVKLNCDQDSNMDTDFRIISDLSFKVHPEYKNLNLDDCSQNNASDINWNKQNDCRQETNSNVLGGVIKRKRKRKHNKKKKRDLAKALDDNNIVMPKLNPLPIRKTSPLRNKHFYFSDNDIIESNPSSPAQAINGCINDIAISDKGSLIPNEGFKSSDSKRIPESPKVNIGIYDLAMGSKNPNVPVFEFKKSNLNSEQKTLIATQVSNLEKKMETQDFNKTDYEKKISEYHSAPKNLGPQKPFDETPYPVINSTKIGDLLLFKKLQMDSNYEPHLSNQIVAKVLSESNDNSGKLCIQVLRGLDEFKSPRGKFSLNEDEYSEIIDDIQELYFQDMIEPRLFFP